MNGDLHTEWARLFVRSLSKAGVRDVVLSPGSRSTPLALAAADDPELRVTPIVDERSAGFFALGQARVTGKPSLLICTSGSAGAHYLPAVLEAERSQTPLIALTADRPWELTLAHANQTLDQTKLFGSHVRAFVELGEPDAAALAALPRIAAGVFLSALAPLPGPVHVNARFRKPLEPVASAGDESWRSELRAAVTRGAPELHFPELAPPSAAVERVAQLCVGARRGLLVAGPLLGTAGQERGVAARRLRRVLRRFVRASGFALVAEAASGVLHGAELDGMALAGFDAWLPAALGAAGQPDLVIEIGSPPTSATWLSLTQREPAATRLLIAAQGIPDPAGTANLVLSCDTTLALERVVAELEQATKVETDEAWRDALVQHATAHLRTMAETREALDEQTLCREIVRALPDASLLLLGNSQVVRHMDVFGGRTSRDVTVLHQRGLSGIEGLIAGAAGARSVAPAASSVLAVLGDVSASHDIGSLALAAGAGAPLVIVVVNNGGGRIFERLPLARNVPEATLRELFVTPPRLSFADAARAFGLRHRVASTRSELLAALSPQGDSALLLEVMVSPEARLSPPTPPPQQCAPRSP